MGKILQKIKTHNLTVRVPNSTGTMRAWHRADRPRGVTDLGGQEVGDGRAVVSNGDGEARAANFTHVSNSGTGPGSLLESLHIHL